ncbi:site-2 protease family protein [Oceanobacillus iheyensis]|nr:site-2 protease family protein [Oceanobacillus iheyensis]
MNLIDIVVFLFIIAPIITLIHEIGHVSGSFVYKATHIFIHIGFGKPIMKKNIRKLQFNINSFYILGGGSFYHFNYDLLPYQRAIIAFLGPLFNIIVFLLLLFQFGIDSENLLISLAIWFNLWLAIVNLIPFKWKEKSSDGLAIWLAIRDIYTNSKMNKS